MVEGARKLRRIGSFKIYVFRLRRYEIIFHYNLTLTGRKFHTVGAATEKAQITACVFPRYVMIDRSGLECVAGVTIDFRYAGCIDESA